MATDGIKPTIMQERSTHFAWLRTRLAVERTLGAWTRTAVSLIGFGFTIFQFFQRLSQMPGVQKPREPWLPEALSVALVVVGTFGLLVAFLEYRWIVRWLWSPEFRDLVGPRDKPMWTPMAGAAVVLILIGLFALLMML